jgi:hypothetical protein
MTRKRVLVTEKHPDTKWRTHKRDCQSHEKAVKKVQCSTAGQFKLLTVLPIVSSVLVTCMTSHMDPGHLMALSVK